MAIRLVTCTNKGYMDSSMGPWMHHARNYENRTSSEYMCHVRPETPDMLPRPVVVCIDFEPNEFQRISYPHVEFRTVSSQEFRAMNSNWCIQHGDWLHAFQKDWCPEDIYIVIDGDALVQRPLTKEEISYIETTFKSEEKERPITEHRDGLPVFPGTDLRLPIGMNWNAGFQDTLEAEAQRIQPKVSLQKLREDWYPDKEMVCCNAGFMIADGRTWAYFYKKYVEFWNKTEVYFGHIARQQWLINWIAQTKPFELELIPLSLHTHGHYGFFEGIGYNQTGVLYKGQPVFCRHKMFWNPHGA